MFIINLILRKVFKRDLKPYIPNFRKAFDHICIHTGGRAVIDEIERQLRLGDAVVEPSRATLYRYGGWEVWAEVWGSVGQTTPWHVQRRWGCGGMGRRGSPSPHTCASKPSSSYMP